MKSLECQNFFHNLVTYPRNIVPLVSESATPGNDSPHICEAQQPSYDVNNCIDSVCENSGPLPQPVHPHNVDHDYCKITDAEDCTPTAKGQGKFLDDAAPVNISTIPVVQEQSALNVPLVKSVRGRPRKKKGTVVISSSSKKKKTLSTSNSHIRVQLQCPPVVHKPLHGWLDDRKFAKICKDHRISPLELKALQGNEWLSDSVINAAELIMSTQLPRKCGFQDVLYGQGLIFKKVKKLISPGHRITN